METQNNNIKKGKFIVLEGADGSGKTTHAKRLAEYLSEKGMPSVFNCEPTEGEIGKLIRRYLSGELVTAERTIAALFVADRLDHITKSGGLLDLLNRGINVVCDRYYLSSVAYNCASEPAEWVFNLNRAATQLLLPDMTLYLDMPTGRLAERLSSRQNIEIYENNAYQEKVKQRYEEGFKMAEEHVIRLSSNRDKKDVFRDILQSIKKLFPSL